jgi:NADPH:quinone reductase-like Zn-dependent oxidoreductase
MNAVVIRACGGVEQLELAEVAKPLPTGSQVLVRVRAAGVNPVDWKIRRGMLRPIYPRKFPFILGGDAAGEVEANGPKASRWKPGDAVYCPTSGSGAYAEYVAVEESHCAAKPTELSFEEAAAIPIAGLTALQAWRDKARVRPGDDVLVNGAAGGVGTFAVQIAAAWGCRVTGVASGRNLDLVRQLGAAEVVDYAQEDFTRQDRQYHAIFDTVAKSSFTACRPRLHPGGAYITTLPSAGALAWSAATCVAGPLGGRRCYLILMKPRGGDLESLNELIAAGTLRPVIDRVYSLEEIRDAHTSSEAGHARGKIVIRIG